MTQTQDDAPKKAASLHDETGRQEELALGLFWIDPTAAWPTHCKQRSRSN